MALPVGLFGLAVWFAASAPAPAFGTSPERPDPAADHDTYGGERERPLADDRRR